MPVPMPFASTFVYTVGTCTHMALDALHCFSTCVSALVSIQYCPFSNASGVSACVKVSVTPLPSFLHSEYFTFVCAAFTVFFLPI